MVHENLKLFSRGLPANPSDGEMPADHSRACRRSIPRMLKEGTSELRKLRRAGRIELPTLAAWAIAIRAACPTSILQQPGYAGNFLSMLFKMLQAAIDARARARRSRSSSTAISRNRIARPTRCARFGKLAGLEFLTRARGSHRSALRALARAQMRWGDSGRQPVLARSSARPNSLKTSRRAQDDGLRPSRCNKS